MNIVEKSLIELTPYKRNPRKNDDAVEAVAESIKQFGFKVPIIVDKDNVIVAGHTRYKAAQQLGLNVVPVIVADDLTQEQIKAFRLADNKVGELAAWDFTALIEELDEIKNIDMAQFGFNDLPDTDFDLDGLFEDAEPKEHKPQKVQCPYCGEWFDL